LTYPNNVSKFIQIRTRFSTFWTVSSAESISEIYKEGQNLKMLRHKNVIELFHCLLENKTLIMIMEVATGGEVF
jgi:serine/threonine protein kinase